MLAKLEGDIKRLARHTIVLNFVILHRSIGIIKLSELSGFPQHQVRYSLRVLEHHNLIKPSPQGAVATARGKKFIQNLDKKIEKLRKNLLDLSKLFY